MADVFDTPLTVIDPDTRAVELPLHLNLEWFDKLRGGVVGVITLMPDEDGGWTFHIGPAQGMIDQAAAEVARRQAEGEGKDDE